MKLDLPSLTQAAESRINNGACLVTVYASTILELIRQHRVMKKALEEIATLNEEMDVPWQYKTAWKALEEIGK